MVPQLHLLTGPNGAGKSTFYEIALKPHVQAPFINADIIQRDELIDPEPQASYRAAKIAEQRRNAYLQSRKSFIAETVFSHPSKLDIIHTAKALGFAVFVYHIGVVKADLSVARVQCRIAEGGHGVPEQKIRERYERNKPLIKKAIFLATKGYVFDNSRLNQSPRFCLSTSHGLINQYPLPLDWVVDLYGPP